MDSRVRPARYSTTVHSWKASMPMKCMAQMPPPMATLPLITVSRRANGVPWRAAIAW